MNNNPVKQPIPLLDHRIDDYILSVEPFAQPILIRLREIVHHTIPEVEETMKWSRPSFDYKGVFCSMCAFKNYVTFGFWKHELIKDPKKLLGERYAEANRGKKNLGYLTSLDDLPSEKIIIDFLLQAKQLNDEDVKLPPRVVKPKKTLSVPDYFIQALSQNKKALTVFELFPPSAQRDYVEWLEEAKTEPTRIKRMDQAVQWISEGKKRHWKYERH